ncbi:Glucokinase [uncultured Stenotrophomonas sp.]|uniref:Glucokinase n=1 Tax=uncultured Stenotrophomonas sp. TaxID=165438 RepID=A0A1Y5Q7I6_9GAMM|nr:Glucokinase [uncultured Stenotrophomonas sp.]
MNGPMAIPCHEEAAAIAVIGADVGGTYARLGWMPTSGAAFAGAPVEIRDFTVYHCAEHPSLGAILCDYAARLRSDPAVPPVAHATVAIAGVLDGDHLLNTNLAWPVSLADTRRETGLDTLEIINDFAAVAGAILHAAPGSRHRLSAYAEQGAPGPALVLGPGTGLGVAVRLQGGHPPVLASEAGHAALAAGNALEMDVLRLLQQRHGHVDNEHVLSGPGLVTLYACLCEREGGTPRWNTPAEIVAAASTGHDPLAVASIRAFCGWLGSLAGDLALTFGARSVHLTGGITDHIARWLHEGDFMQRFLAKGRLSPMLQQVPVWRIEHGQLGVLGALAWHMEK